MSGVLVEFAILAGAASSRRASICKSKLARPRRVTKTSRCVSLANDENRREGGQPDHIDNAIDDSRQKADGGWQCDQMRYGRYHEFA